MPDTLPSSPAQPAGYTPPPARQNGLALAALILGVASIFINPILITSILAIVLGIIGLRRAPLLGRRNLALIGIVLAVIGAIVSIVVTSAIFGSIGRAAQTISEASQPAVVAPNDDTTTDTAPSAEAEEPSEPAEEAIPAEYRSALAQAQTYSDSLHLSKDGIYDQLTSDYGGKFPKKAAQYAVDNLDADFSQNALEQAKTYQNDLNLSRSGVHDQLTSDNGGKFTKKQADYALEHLDD